jgi:DNA (cytosine-5)-methyltransferase 1
MEDRALQPAAIWSDLATFDGSRFRGMVDLVSAGFPCPDYSVAGKREGRFGKHGQVWDHVIRIIREVGPGLVVLENVSGILVPHGAEDEEWVLPAGLHFVLGDLAESGFDAEWTCLRASTVGAPHHRERLWLLAAHPNRQRELLQASAGNQVRNGSQHGSWWATEPDVGRVVDGLAAGTHELLGADVTASARLGALGNGQVPLVAAVAFASLARRFGVEILDNEQEKKQ